MDETTPDDHELYRTDIAHVKSRVHIDDDGYPVDGDPIASDPIDSNIPFFSCECGVEHETLREALDHLAEHTDIEING